jgi:uncharacterized alpha-E superfamily protein
MKPLPNFDIASLSTLDEVFSQLEDNIRRLAGFLDGAMSEQDAQQFMDNLYWLKRFYERAEVLARDGE